ncbi:hypothetical protein AB0O08_01260 [Streptomyces anulatus]|uniref:hypothetical protein n=1 Tax=Streptomyces anulatus TaxID=1892 RepID=UPI00342AE42A
MGDVETHGQQEEVPLVAVDEPCVDAFRAAELRGADALVPPGIFHRAILRNWK